MQIQPPNKIETHAWMEVWTQLYQYELPVLCRNCALNQGTLELPERCDGVFVLGYLPSDDERIEIGKEMQKMFPVEPSEHERRMRNIPIRNQVKTWWCSEQFAWCFPLCVPLQNLAFYGEVLQKFKPSWRNPQEHHARYHQLGLDLVWQFKNDKDEIVNADPSDDHWDTMVMGINSGLHGQGFQTSGNVRPKRKMSRSYPFLFNVPPVMFDSAKQVRTLWREGIKWNTVQTPNKGDGKYLEPSTFKIGDFRSIMTDIKQVGHRNSDQSVKNSTKKRRKLRTHPEARKHPEALKKEKEMLNPKKKEEGTTTPKTEKATPTTRAAAILATLCTTFQKSYNVWSGFELELFESKSPYCHSLNINNLKPHEKHPADCQCTQRRFLVQLPFF